MNKEPGGGSYGPDTCMQGFVWREAFDGDTICVMPDIRSATLADNAAAESRKAANSPQPTPTPTPMTTSITRPQAGGTVVFEVTGSGEVFSIDTDPAGSSVPDHTKLPFTRTMTIGSDVHLLQVVAVGRDDPGSRLSNHPERHGRRRTTRRRQCALHLLATRLEAKPAELFGVALPVLRDLHP